MIQFLLSETNYLKVFSAIFCQRILVVELVFIKKQQLATRSNKRKQQGTFYNLKPNPPKKPTTTNDSHIEQPRRLYASAVKGNVYQPNITIKQRL